MSTDHKIIYLDYAATTPVHPAVLDAMQPYFQDRFGNSSSGLHPYGWDAEAAVQESRKKVSDVLGCAHAKEVIFTSGATESNNWALRGIIEQLILSAEKKIHILSSKVEHNSVLKTLEHLPKIFPQVEVEFVETNRFGQVDLQSLEKKIRPTETKLMSFMWVNNELGSCNPVEKIGEIARRHQILFHTDATQAVGKIGINFQHLPIDLLSFSAHKIYGPKGIGALLVRSQNPTVSISPLLLGGGQERGLRSGTINTPAVVGLARALEIAEHSRESEWNRIQRLRGNFLENIPEHQLNGHPTESIPHILSLSFPQLPQHAQFTGFAYSQGSACHSGSASMSHVLSALHFAEEEAQRTFRFSLGKDTSEENLWKLSELIQNRINSALSKASFKFTSR